jgi:aminopeptidase YwaD
LRGTGEEYAYEALNLVNGENTIAEIRNMLSAQFGPVSGEDVAAYLEALESINVIHRIR